MKRVPRRTLPEDVRNASDRMKRSKSERNAACPWCNTPIKRPSAVFSCLQTEFHGGNCQCGATFLVDPSGKNMGRVLMDLLLIVFPTKTTGDFPDYAMKQFLYQPEMHTIRASKEINRTRSAKIIFLKSIPRS